MAAEWKRLHQLPRRWLRACGGELSAMSPKARYIYERSVERYRRRPDAIQNAAELLAQGEIGRYESIRFIKS